LTARAIAALSGATTLEGDGDRVVTGVSTDTRTLRSGELFVALAGPRFDGHLFAENALASGAGALLVSRPVAASAGVPVIRVSDTLAALGRLAAAYRDRFDIRAVAVTGSVGKTTTKDVLAQVLSGSFRTVSSRRSFNNSVGVPLTLLSIENDTQAAVVELGASARGEIAALAALVRPDVGIITAVREAHLAGFGTLEEVRRAKGELLGALEDGTAVLNADDPSTPQLAGSFSGKVVTFGQTPEADVRVLRVVEGEAGLVFRIRAGGRQLEGRIGLAGRHQIGAVAAALAAARELGVDLEEAVGRLAGFESAAGRLRRVPAGPVLLYDDSYNASPASVREAIAFLSRRAGDRRGVLVLGDMLDLGEHSERLHLEIGRELAGRAVAVVVAVGRYAGLLAVEARRRSGDRIHVLPVPDSIEAARVAARIVEPGDCVLVKGSRGVALEKVVEAIHRLFRKEERTLRLETAMS
ncbi:MAG: UDP-N-acetylmuramoyl-tripeptide--D-alanyl-D-alanine ligase, partial [Planctomycetes bacterium]|nr:UDP-N-acetylmuramoyl-tripeptide--D-alanyl-D-alanine ligase [Planctomycetota bacterium]